MKHIYSTAVSCLSLLLLPTITNNAPPNKKKVKRGVNGAPDEEVLFVFKDGKQAPPLYVDGVGEEELTLSDGSVPPDEV
jgi:hypothetical protein